jgi:hypothetical protein
MLIRLGRTSTPSDAADLVLECHERIRFFCALARRIPSSPASDAGAIAEAAARVRRYFVEALPLHARDEEESILPRLGGREPAVDAALAAMTREHAEHEAPLAAVVTACGILAGEPGRLGEVAPALADAARELEAHFVTHLAGEETVIVPAMRRLLDPAADAEIVREIRARRGAGDGQREQPPSP